MPKTLRTNRGLVATALALLLGGACSSVPPNPAGLDDARVIVAIRVIRAEPEKSAASAPSREQVATSSTKATDDPDAIGERGDAFARAGRVSEAIAEYQRVVDLEPDDAAHHFKLGLAFQSVRRFDEALTAYQAAARLEPESPWAHAAVAIVLAKMGKQEAAFTSYRTVKQLDDELARDLLPILMQYGDVRDV